MEPAEGIRRYFARLADIYRSEEAIGGLPITMEGFCLFDEEHRTSRPLCLAYEAARICDPDRADAFLTALRHATVADCRPTTHDDEILRVVRETGIDEEAYLGHYRNGSAEAALERDLALTHRMGIHSLPSYLVQLGSEPW
jgi:predicted DsbA family dithiol-disulfide isomerase